jgi:hypothetical protein
MSTGLIIGGVVLGAAFLVGVAFMGKKREETEDTGFGVSNSSDDSETQSGGKRSKRQKGSRKRKSRSRRSKRVKI